jgi:hypothetical protein
MNPFVMERDLPGVGEFSLTGLCGAARASNQVLKTIGPAIQWQHSDVAKEKTFCIRAAESEVEIRKHAEPSGIPAPKVTEVGKIIDPLTTNY